MDTSEKSNEVFNAAINRSDSDGSYDEALYIHRIGFDGKFSLGIIVEKVFLYEHIFRWAKD